MPSSVRDIPRLSDADVRHLRGPRNVVDPWRPYAHFVEPERNARGIVEDVATILITNKECPFSCLMCDLWRNTTRVRVPEGAVAAQIEWTLQSLPWTPSVKLFNAGSFFDDQAIPHGDWSRIATLLENRNRVVVECHPRLVGRRCLEFSELLEPSLEVAMGLETVDPQVLPRLNKRMTVDDFARATKILTEHGVGVRAFILLRAPYQSEEEGVHWAMRSIEYAFSVGVECCSLIPTRGGNGAMEWLAERGHFTPPSLRSMEQVLEYGLGLHQGRVFVDIWDIERFFGCPTCSAQRAGRLAHMNHRQEAPASVVCGCATRT